MYGAIFGDIVGSPYEFDRGEKTKLFRLFTETSTYTDDTVMTLAVSAALVEAGPTADPSKISDLVARWMRKLGKDHPDAGYGGRFSQWLRDPDMGPYNSFGNGSAMRVSPAGWFYDSIERTREVARATAMVTHNHPEGIKGAESVASVIFFARNGWTKPMLKSYVQREFGYDLDRTLDEIRPNYHMDETCQGSVPEAIIAFLEAEDFEDAIRGAVSIGGDTDTVACIAGSMAEAYYGVPDEFREEVVDRLPEDLLPLMAQGIKLRDGLMERNDLPTAIRKFNQERSNENAGRVINALAVRQKAGGLFYVPLEIADKPAKDFELIFSPKPDEKAARRSISSTDNRRWAVAFTSEIEARRKSEEPTYYMPEPVGFTVDITSKLDNCSGLAIDPWGASFFMSQEMIKTFLEKTRKTK